jgi:hypothetical protein
MFERLHTKSFALFAVLSGSLFVASAHAEIPCGGDGPPCAPPPPSALPSLPPGLTTQGMVSATVSDPVAPGQTFFIGGDAGYVPRVTSITASSGSAALPGDGSGVATITTLFGSDPTIIASVTGYGSSGAHHNAIVADGTLIYRVLLHAADLNAANALAPLLSQDGAIARVAGKAIVSASGSAYGNAIIHTGDGIFDNYYTGPGQSLYGDLHEPHRLLGFSEDPCFPNGGFGVGNAVVTTGCGVTPFDLAVNFIRASDAYADGSALDFVSNISLRAAAVVFGDSSGTANVTIDPTITLAGSLNPANYTLTVGPAGGVVPEPAGWALMVLGLGGVGAALRRGRGELARAM